MADETLVPLTYKVGPHSYENWKLHDKHNRSFKKGCEYELFSDVHFVGEIIDPLLGPYRILNPTPVHTYLPSGRTPSYKMHSALILRCLDTYPVGAATPPIDTQDFKTEPVPDRDNYHGGTLADEIASLLSLLFGVRIQAGRYSREFDSHDLLGRAFFIYDKPEPALPMGTYIGIIPSLTKECHFQPIARRMFSYSKLNPDDAVALIRAARAYQNAVWVAESDPNLSWLWLVSSIEIVASQGDPSDPVEALKLFKPNLVKLLEDNKVSHLIPAFAKDLEGITSSTKKFLNFLLNYYPPAPLPNRPSIPDAQVEWTSKNLKSAFNKIYTHRSKALHSGKPFPFHLCTMPFRLDRGKTMEEKPIGDVRQAQGAIWDADDLPMHLYVFEYIVREALIKWWIDITPSGYK